MTDATVETINLTSGGKTEPVVVAAPAPAPDPAPAPEFAPAPYPEDVVFVDEEGDLYIEAPPGGQFGSDGETNHSRVLQPADTRALRTDDYTGVDADYPRRASRGRINPSTPDGDS
jgi:hypothetical protein